MLKRRKRKWISLMKVCTYINLSNEIIIKEFEFLVLKEIEERKQFLDDMKRLGKDQLHNNKISTEISQKIRELELIDKQRCDKLLLVNN